MSQMTIRVAAIGASIFLLLISSNAEAAKGIKNGNQGNGTHTVSGIIMKVVPDKTGYGVFELKTAYNHRKMNFANGGAAANGAQINGAIANQQMRKLNVTSATMFEHHMGQMTNMVNAAALQRGQHVRVRFTGEHAEQVHIYTPMHMNGRRMSNNFMRHRTSAYYPHLSHHRR